MRLQLHKTINMFAKKTKGLKLQDTSLFNPVVEHARPAMSNPLRGRMRPSRRFCVSQFRCSL